MMASRRVPRAEMISGLSECPPTRKVIKVVRSKAMALCGARRNLNWCKQLTNTCAWTLV